MSIFKEIDPDYPKYIHGNFSFVFGKGTNKRSVNAVISILTVRYKLLSWLPFYFREKRMILEFSEPTNNGYMRWEQKLKWGESPYKACYTLEKARIFE